MELSKEIRPITKKEAHQSYLDLKNAPCDPGMGRAGLKALDYLFLQHRIKTRVKNISFYEAMRDPKKRDYLDELIYRVKKVNPDELDHISLQKKRYAVFQLYYGSVNQFRPLMAKWVYCLFKPKRILDFSAGWGGRCIAALSLGIPYIGIDSNASLKSAYDNLLLYEPATPVTMIFKPSEQVDYSKFKYDLCFTSPPYFTLEKYQNMPSYTKETFLTQFFIPVVKNVWKHLEKNGHLVLNMPEEMYVAIRDLLPPLKQILPLHISNKHPTQAVKRSTLTSESRNENIYVWQKKSNRTKKARRIL